MTQVFSYRNIDALKSFYNKNGYVTINDLFNDDEIRAFSDAYDDAVKKGQIEVDSEKMLDCNDAIYRHVIFNKYVKDERIIHIVETLLNRSGLELQHSKLNSKPLADQGKGVVNWHQDFPFFPHTNFDLIAVGIHFDDEDEDSGPLRYAPGSHQWGVLSHNENDVFAYQCTDQERIKNMESISLCCKAGYVTIHHCLTLHASDFKKNNKHRRLLVFQYRALDNIQLAGVIWKCTGLEIKSGVAKGYARFNDGSIVEIRGKNGRLYDKYGKLAPDKLPVTSY